LCWLRQQHHLTDNATYDTLRVATLHTTDVQVIRITSDWIEQP
jgi:hypothetical protein